MQIDFFKFLNFLRLKQVLVQSMGMKYWHKNANTVGLCTRLSSQSYFSRTSQGPPSFGVHTSAHLLPVTGSARDALSNLEWPRVGQMKFLPGKPSPPVTALLPTCTPRFTLILRLSQHTKWQSEQLLSSTKYFQWLCFKTKVYYVILKIS